LKLIPRDEQFYDLFSQVANRLYSSADLLHQLFVNPSQLETHVSKIKDLEHEADDLTHEIIDRIDRTFVTPFDREDIHELASHLDEVVDLIDGAARRAQIFRITQPREPGVRLADVLVRAARAVEEAVKGMKEPKTVNKGSRDLKVLEEEGDAIYHEAMGALFTDGIDPLEVIKWKELYEQLEDAIDQCEDVGNVLQSISLKNA
jgi:predicted phosphate transport protein (TIGR00153 family)